MAGARRAQDPISRQFYPAGLIGAFVPDSGDPTVCGVLSGGSS